MVAEAAAAVVATAVKACSNVACSAAGAGRSEVYLFSLEIRLLQFLTCPELNKPN